MGRLSIINDPEVSFQLSKGTFPKEAPPEEETPEQPTQPQPGENEEETQGLIGGAETPWAFIILGSAVAVAVMMLSYSAAKSRVYSSI